MKGVSVTVRDVGQGDCITLEWIDDDGVNQIGLIDCNKDKGNVDALINYINTLGYKELYFCVFTHPHTDHYSGFLDLYKGLIKIKDFYIRHLYCPSYDSTDNLRILFESFHKSVENTSEQEKDLLKLYQFIGENTGESMFIKNLYNVTGYMSCHLFDNIALDFISPSLKEWKEYLKKENFNKLDPNYDLTKEDINNPNANRLSIVTALVNKVEKKTLALFTSDCEKPTFTRLSREKYAPYFAHISSDIDLVQVPHHGSKRNHHEKFWSGKTLENSVSFISVGRSGYNHPNEDVVEYWNKNSKDLKRTDESYLTEDMDNHDLLSLYGERSSKIRQNNIVIKVDI